MGLNPVNLSTQQDARKAVINSVINHLESQLNAVANKDNIEVRSELYDLFNVFDTRNSTNTGIAGTKSLTGSEITALINNLKNITVNNTNILNLFNTDGSIKTSAVHDYNGDGLKDIKDLDALNRLLTDQNNDKTADLVASNRIVFNRETLVNSLSIADKAIYTELTNTPGVSDEDEAFFLLNIAGKPVDQRLKDSYLNIFKNGTVTDAKIELLKNFVDHQTSGSPKATSDYVDLFILNYDTQSNLTNANSLLNILKSSVPNKNTFISSLEAISRNGDNQTITQMVLNTFTSTPSNLGSGISDTEANKFNSLLNNYSLSTTDRDNYYRIITSNSPSSMVLDEFETMFSSNKYSLDKSNLLLAVNNNATHPLRTAGTLQDYFVEEFRAGTSSTNANNIHSISSANRANYNNSLISLYNYNKSPVVLGVLAHASANSISLETVLNSAKIDQLTQFINDKSGESALDQSRYLRYISTSTALPSGWLSAYEGMFADPSRGIASTYTTNKANLFDSAVSNSTLRNSASYNSQFLAYFNDGSKFDYADALNTVTSRYAGNATTRDFYVNSLQLASQDTTLSSRIAQTLKRDAGSVSLTRTLNATDFTRFKTLYSNPSTPTADEDALFEGIKRNAHSQIIDAFLTEFTPSTRASDPERSTFINAVRSSTVNSNADYRNVYLEAYNTDAALAQRVVDIANSTLPSKANYDLSIKTISNNMGVGGIFDITTGLSNVVNSLNSLRAGNINISRGLDQSNASNFDSFARLVNTTSTHENRYLKYLLGDENTNTPSAANDALWASKYRSQFTNAAISSAQLNSREALIETAYYTSRLTSSSNNSDLFFQMLDLSPSSSTLDTGFTYADNLQRILAHNGNSGFTQTVRDTYISNLEKAFEAVPPLALAMSNLLRRQALANNNTVKVFSDEEIEQFRTIIDRGATDAQQDLLFRAISTNKDKDLINAYVNAFVDGSISSDTTTNKTQLFADAIDSSINNNGDLQDLFLYAYKKDAGDAGAIQARKILNIVNTTNFANNSFYISTLEKIDQNISTVLKGSGFNEIINALSTNHTNRIPLTRIASNEDITRFDDFSSANWVNSPAKINPDPVAEERFFKYLFTDRIIGATNRRDDWVARYETIYRTGVANTLRSDLYEDAFNNSSTNSSLKYTDMFLNMIDDPATSSYIYAKTLNGIQPPSTEFSGLTRSTNPSKETYIDNLQKIYTYSPALSDTEAEKISKILERHISTNYQTNYLLSDADISNFKILFNNGASVEQQDLLFKAISENKDRDLINAYVTAFTDGSITSDTTVTIPAMPTGFTPKTVLFQRAINSTAINSNGNLQDLFLYAYRSIDGITSKQAEQILNIVETNEPSFTAQSRYISSLEAINLKTSTALPDNVSKGSGFVEIMNALSANHSSRISIDRGLTATDIDRFDTFNNLGNENNTDRARFMKYQLNTREIASINQNDKWLSSFEKMFTENYVNDDRRGLFDEAFGKLSLYSSLDYTDTFKELFDRPNGYKFANSLVRTMVDSVNPSKDSYIDNLERAAELIITEDFIDLLERQLQAGSAINRTLNDREFGEYTIMFSAVDGGGIRFADNDDLDKLFKMHSYDPDNDAGIDNDLEAAFVKMFQDGTISIGKTVSTPSRKETLLDRLLPDSLTENDANKIILVDKTQIIESIDANGNKVSNTITYSAEQQQLDFLKYINKDQYMNFAKDLILDYFINAYKNPSPEQQNTLTNNFGVGVEATLVDKIKSGAITNAIQFRTEFAALAPTDNIDTLITKIADITANGIPVDPVTGEQRLIFAETFAAILAIDNSTAENVANGTANNIARDYIPSLNNMFALNADDKLVNTLKRFAEAGRKFEAWMTAEDIEIFSELGASPYFIEKEVELTDLYVEMALSLQSLTPEEKDRKENYREAFRDILLYNYPSPAANNISDPIFASNLDIVMDKMKIMESMIDGLAQPDSQYTEKVFRDPTTPTEPLIDRLNPAIKLLSRDETNLLIYLSSFENINYPISQLDLINTQRSNTTSTATITSDPELERARARFQVTDPITANNIAYINNYSGTNGFNANAVNDNINKDVASLTANILRVSEILIKFPGETFNKPASVLEQLSSFTLNSGSNLKDSIQRLNTELSDWLNDAQSNPPKKDTDLMAKLNQLSSDILTTPVAVSNNSVIANAFTEIKKFTDNNRIIGTNTVNRNIFTNSEEDRVSKKMNVVQDLFNSGKTLNTIITSNDLSFMDKLENIKQKYTLDTDNRLYDNIIRNFDDPSKKNVIMNILDDLADLDTKNINLSYIERRSVNRFTVNALVKMLADPTKSIFEGFNDQTILKNIKKSLESNKASEKIFPDAYSDFIFNTLLTAQETLLSGNTSIAATEARTLINNIRNLPNDFLINDLSEKMRVNKLNSTEQASKTTALQNLINNHGDESDIDLFKAYINKTSQKNNVVTDNLKKLIEYEGRSGFRVSAQAVNLQNDNMIKASAEIIDLLDNLNADPKYNDSRLTSFLEDSVNIILSSPLNNEARILDFFNNFAITKIEDYLADPNLSAADIDNIIQPFIFMSKGINSFDPDLITAYRNLLITNPSSTDLHKLETIMRYQGSGGFKINSGLSTLNNTQIDRAYSFISLADELSDTVEFKNSSIVRYLEQSVNIYLQPGSTANLTEQDNIKQFISNSLITQRDAILDNPNLSAADVSDLLRNLIIDSESLINPAESGHKAASLRAAEKENAGSRNPVTGALNTRIINGSIYSNSFNTNQVVLNETSNIRFRERGLNNPVLNSDNTVREKSNNPEKVQAQIDIYETFRTTLEGLLSAESDQNSSKATQLKNAIDSYSNIINSLSQLLTNP